MSAVIAMLTRLHGLAWWPLIGMGRLRGAGCGGDGLADLAGKLIRGINCDRGFLPFRFQLSRHRARHVNRISPRAAGAVVLCGPSRWCGHLLALGSAGCGSRVRCVLSAAARRTPLLGFRHRRCDRSRRRLGASRLEVKLFTHRSRAIPSGTCRHARFASGRASTVQRFCPLHRFAHGTFRGSTFLPGRFGLRALRGFAGRCRLGGLLFRCALNRAGCTRLCGGSSTAAHGFLLHLLRKKGRFGWLSHRMEKVWLPFRQCGENVAAENVVSDSTDGLKLAC